MKAKLPILPLLLAGLTILVSCRGSAGPDRGEVLALDQPAHIFPDYTGVTIPVNIAPLNFTIRDEGDSFMALFEGEQGNPLKVKSRENVLSIPAGRWARLLSANQGSQIMVTVLARTGDPVAMARPRALRTDWSLTSLRYAVPVPRPIPRTSPINIMASRLGL